MLTVKDFSDMLKATTNSEKLLRTRSMFLAKLYRDMEATSEDLSFLNDTRSVMKIINAGGNINTAKTRNFHLIALIKLRKYKKALTKKAIDYYSKKAQELKDAGNKAYENNLMTDQQRDRYMSIYGMNVRLKKALIDLFNDYKINRSFKIS